MEFKNIKKRDVEIININFNDNLGEVFDFIDLKKKNNLLPSKKKERLHYQEGYERSKNGKVVYKKRVIDKDNNLYFELIKDTNGNTLHKCEEPLNLHVGHGSDKFNTK
ncbi:MAG: hypothetical protein BM557_09710 [Flavobacterium sp. MedPE-SWcel]|uniref:hypothetical protein n=1 Tax=uncultured Flavobacterium sp. TaxID=165435 RepID=UPI00090F1B02|nr:hypothetical protein [uncultured Flavobacterium sp.]OIQ16577.1 MAG: hypothetical protein BM557_09710 [Flavobacterium sp. MedPE-SWcel]